MKQRNPAGIDLGTTFCAASYVDERGSTQMVPMGAGEHLVPSVVAFAEERILVGGEALAAELLDPAACARSAKRDMGRAAYRNRIHGQEYPPEVIQGCLLRSLRERLEAHLGGPASCVVTVPAYFDELRRKATADAATISGLDLIDIVNEPTAAALAFGEKLGYLSRDGAPSASLKLLVYDLGGGTFDVSVVELGPGFVRTLATDGDYELGGLHWDERIAEFALERFRRLEPHAEEPTPSERVALLRAANAAKHALSESPLTSMLVTLAGRSAKIPLRRDEFEELTGDLLERTLFTARQSILAAGLLWNKLDRVLLVGGSTRMPMVRAELQRESGLVPDWTVHPDEAVARGAAIFAHQRLAKDGNSQLPPLRITDVNSHSIGIEGISRATLRKERAILIPRNTPLPHSAVRRFVTNRENQRSVQIKLLEGESSIVEHCTLLATAGIRNLPPGLPEGSAIEVTYELGSNGRLAIAANVGHLGDDAQIELSRVNEAPVGSVLRWQKLVCADGGYRRLEDALDDLVSRSLFERSTEEGDDSAEPFTREPVVSRPAGKGPAIDHGAPRAAAEVLEEARRPGSSRGPSAAVPVDERTPELRPHPYRRKPPTPLVWQVANLALHLVASGLGVLAGYVALTWVRPDLDFLGWNLFR